MCRPRPGTGYSFCTLRPNSCRRCAVALTAPSFGLRQAISLQQLHLELQQEYVRLRQKTFGNLCGNLMGTFQNMVRKPCSPESETRLEALRRAPPGERTSLPLPGPTPPWPQVDHPGGAFDKASGTAVAALAWLPPPEGDLPSHGWGVSVSYKCLSTARPGRDESSLPPGKRAL